jgi:hypothetical protein
MASTLPESPNLWSSLSPSVHPFELGEALRDIETPLRSISAITAALPATATLLYFCKDLPFLSR